MVEDRTVQLIIWMRNNAHIINRDDNVQIVFNCSGAKNIVEIKHRLEIERKPAQLQPAK